MTLEEQTVARDLIIKSLACLTAREADILVARYAYGVHLHEIAADHGFASRERVRQILTVTLNKVRRHLLGRHRIGVPVLLAELASQREHQREYHEYIAQVEQTRKWLREREVPFAPLRALHPLVWK